MIESKMMMSKTVESVLQSDDAAKAHEAIKVTWTIGNGT